MSDTQELKTQFWKSLSASPFVFLGLDAEENSAVPMTAQLDEDANSSIWFFTRRDACLAKLGQATATFQSKGHDMFCRFSGRLVEETDPARLDQFWSNIIEAWFPAGKDDPDLLLMRMDLGNAEIWNSDLGLIDNVKMLLGFDSREEAKEEHVETAL